MELTKTDVRGVAVVGIRGKLVGGPTNDETFDEFFAALFTEGTTRIVVDLRDTPWANSQGIGMLIGAYVEAKTVGGALVLAGAGPRITDLLAVTKLSEVFDSFETVAQAVDRLADHHPLHDELAAPQSVPQRSLETELQ